MTGPSPADESPCQVPAHMANLPLAIQWLEAACQRQRVDAGTVLRLTLLLEELFTNTVLHGHGVDSDAPVQLALSALATTVQLDYADTAAPFNPLAYAAATSAELDADLADRPVGRLGLQLIHQMASAASYQFDRGWNRVSLVLQRPADSPGSV